MLSIQRFILFFSLTWLLRGALMQKERIKKKDQGYAIKAKKSEFMTKKK
jgi:hypothetical protein